MNCTENYAWNMLFIVHSTGSVLYNVPGAISLCSKCNLVSKTVNDAVSHFGYKICLVLKLLH